METFEAYLDRKYEELTLLSGFLDAPLPLRRPTSVPEVIEHKFHIAAALKAQHALHDWALTETAWAHPGRLRAGPFQFSYDYQRADLEVRGPSFYQFDHSTAANQTIYTSSGMAAISALLLAFARLVPEADILALPGSYGETLELIENHARQFRLVLLKSSPDEVASDAGPSRILLFDSCTPAAAFEATLRCETPQLDLVIFDTTCFSTGSGRIRRVVSWARRWEVPIVLVRSHTKLDSLGVEYGRLGSAVLVACEKHVAPAKQERLEGLASEMRNAVRLFGGAAVPAHFPPYVGTKTYRALTDRRVAAILRNSRRTARCFASALAGSAAELHFAHGLYVTLAPKRMLDEKPTKQMAAELCDDLRRDGLLLRHAGSFGFDFGAAEWFRDIARNRHLVRIAVPDLPTPLWDQVARAVVQWWSAHEEENFQPAGLPTIAPA
ncbi:hypothetical protein [Bradyrhizobium icense]|uniref:Aminotransferase class I/classII domain-containing protein n=1 Tax=Bradyrhizobium icense TaxID=1274631 RepID=A0A1B1UKW0_9BRAD|nr:hypothetical protein [Bradyrhizobium icense]ANW03368.1 hypothetical protein LMTR13_27765 [Bradyrhizobium icense]